ncbi:hypothetical protein IMG5_023400 [Ichthyophthirius multifiliis]|uniref:Fatty acid desaturase domain-containing protein n=1 Tax=Ichthyophthirius multifiliis TaxID=5932 RepID=G0QKZ5_ICHMU|nr:hypothetical protein IMG5_023400 [Ichthyophthirius multifiliis]EGR34116.1 hypothetical protein IMG5_023400 [Ichthyophthirius multifiliis]|eukprot:XP_004039420.1 hypothetical protein IMG5_023400 [Ichthyophthirius multifiliis]
MQIFLEQYIKIKKTQKIQNASKEKHFKKKKKNMPEIKNSIFNGEREITLSDIKDAIPAHLFKRSELRFFISVFNSVSLTLLTAYIAHKVIPLQLSYTPLWLLYGIINGTIAVGIWILGHECSHGAFSEKKWANDLLGYILHTIVFVPYFSWQYSHNIHHSKCNNIIEDETHVPKKEGNPRLYVWQKIKEKLGTESLSIIYLLNLTLIGLPLYLMFGASTGSSRNFSSHFIVPNDLFNGKMLFKVHLSNLGIVFVIYLLYLWAKATCFMQVLFIYLIPYVVVNGWISIITFLQHNDEDVPHFDNRTWSWLKGAMCTIDRNYPEYINALHHNIGNTHVLHHVFHELPHYHAREANVYFKQIVGSAYIQDKKTIWQAILSNSKLICVKEKEEGVYYYK